ncbi:peptidase PmbA [Buchnera aphidicola (Schlechtendalia chinensis)]|uniref:Peptidase PmbA n=1 Tax=Buchnera aphidicola subsp. Schlechtendalia chinensis TaxID=118110 RepID=A0A172WD58_BUCSC|nr:metalloprotease PmbA [Buchnera aphidicola]ANF16899.1 peptidase PmbA [Buchnera aphidicola (Schlechtendalia chinensis)]
MKFDYEFKEKQFKNVIIYILNLVSTYSATAEVLISYKSSVDLNMRNKKIDYVKFSDDNFITITVYKSRRKSTVSSSDFSISSLKKSIDRAMDIINYVSCDLLSGLPDVALLAIGNLKNLNLYHYWKWDLNYAYDLTLLSESEAFKVDKRIVNTEGSTFNSCISINVFGNSHGMLESYNTTSYFMSSCMIAKDKHDMQRDMSYTIARNINDLTSPKLLGITSSNRAISRLNSKKLSSVKSPIIFSSELSSEFFSYLIQAIDGHNVYKKSTFLLNSLEKRIFPNWLNIQEDPHIVKGLGSKCFDLEGVRTSSRMIVENGILKTWLLDNYSSKRIGLVNTANSGGIHNWLILGFSEMNLKMLLELMNTGILITELLGNGLNVSTGDYSCGAVGFWIEHGIVKYPVSEITISGNLKDMFQNIVSIGNDIDTRHKILSGSILLSSIQISGL